jgi:hypothetical protein
MNVPLVQSRIDIKAGHMSPVLYPLNFPANEIPQRIGIMVVVLTTDPKTKGAIVSLSSQ